MPVKTIMQVISSHATAMTLLASSNLIHCVSIVQSRTLPPLVPSERG